MKTYKAISFDIVTGNLTVVFDGANIPIAVDVPIDETGNYIVGEALDAWISGFFPHSYVARTEQIKNGIPNIDVIRAMVPDTPQASGAEQVLSAEAEANIQMWNQIETEKTIAKTLVKFGVLATDPTLISTTQL